MHSSIFVSKIQILIGFKPIMLLMNSNHDVVRSKIRWMIILFVVLLILSGLTAFPLQTGINSLAEIKSIFPAFLQNWIETIQIGINDTWPKYPFIAYGTDWLGFAHIMIGMAFIGVYKEPVRNKWIIQWAILCCIAVLPLALICGPIRQIPWFHIIIDCSFGIVGIVPFLLVKKWISQLENIQ
jgi:hypothetical protein